MALKRRKHLQRRMFWLLISLLIAVAALADVYFVGRNSKVTNSFSNIGSAKSDQTPTVKLQAYTIPESLISFNYPASWKLIAGESPFGPYASARTPQTSIEAPDGLYINILTDADSTQNLSSGRVLYARKISALGGTYYLDYINVSGDNQVNYVDLFNGPFINSSYPSVTMPGGVSNRLVVSIGYNVSGGASEKPLSAYNTDPDMSDAIRMVESLTN